MFNQLKKYQAALHHIATAHDCMEVAAFDVQQGTPKLLCHLRGEADADEAMKQAAIREFIKIIGLCVPAKRDGVFCVDKDTAPKPHQYCLVTLARRGETVVGAAAFIVRCKGEPEAQVLLSDIQKGIQRFHDVPLDE